MKKYFIAFSWTRGKEYGKGSFIYKTDKDMFTENEILKAMAEIENLIKSKNLVILNIIPLND